MSFNHELKTPSETQLHSFDEEMTELSLLVPSWQVQALEQAAQSEGITMGEYLRRALQQSLSQFVLPPRRLKDG